MKSLLNLVLFAATAGAPLAALAQYDRPWESLQCTRENRRDADDFASYMRERIRAAEAFARRCDGDPQPQPPSNECIQYLLGKGYGPTTARTTCDGLTETSFACVRHVMEKGYGPQSAKTTCAGVREAEFECIKDMLERGYGPDTSRKTCVTAPR